MFLLSTKRDLLMEQLYFRITETAIRHMAIKIKQQDELKETNPYHLDNGSLTLRL